jgi:hypothetical protein
VLLLYGFLLPIDLTLFTSNKQSAFASIEISISKNMHLKKHLKNGHLQKHLQKTFAQNEQIIGSDSSKECAIQITQKSTLQAKSAAQRKVGSQSRGVQRTSRRRSEAFSNGTEIE